VLRRKTKNNRRSFDSLPRFCSNEQRSRAVAQDGKLTDGSSLQSELAVEQLLQGLERVGFVGEELRVLGDAHHGEDLGEVRREAEGEDLLAGV
jgi:hypothetical protein